MPKIQLCRVSGVALALLMGPLLAFPVAAVEPARDDSFYDEFQEFDLTEDPTVSDPLEPYNRLMTRFNLVLCIRVLDPVARGYGKVVPGAARRALSRFFRNLGFPVRFVGNLLQGKLRRSGEELLRFTINTTAGVGGLFDPGAKLGLEAHAEDSGQTLGFYGLGGGWPLVLPFLGPSNLRDTLGRLLDFRLAPVSYVKPGWAGVGIRVLEQTNQTSLRPGACEAAIAGALDPYIFLRHAYGQLRQNEIRE